VYFSGNGIIEGFVYVLISYFFSAAYVSSNYVSQLCILPTIFFIYLRIYRKYTYELNAHNQHFLSSETLLKYIARIANDLSVEVKTE